MKRGRKSYFDTRIQPRLLEIAAWCRDGQIEKDMAKALGISYETFRVHKKANSAFSDALKVNKEIADITVENSLFKRANGYEYTETTKEIKTDEKGKVISKHIKTIDKQLAGDTKAMERWLMNRMPEKWREVKHLEHSGEIKTPSLVINIAKKNGA